MAAPTRAELLVDLAAAIDELVAPRHHVEIIEAQQRNGKKRRRVRRRRITQLPGLLEAVARAAEPEVTGETMAAATGGESKPPVNVEAVHALKTIGAASAAWARALNVRRETLPARLRGLVGASMTDVQLANLTRNAAGWVRIARQASREDAPALTLDVPCPYCARRNAITVAGTLDYARCAGCGKTWDDVTIWLLGGMIQQDRAEPARAVRCAWPQCPVRGLHEVHGDGQGRTFRDRCHVADRLAPAF